MKKSLFLSRRRRVFTPLLAAATLVTLAGCANLDEVSARFSQLLGNTPRQAEANGNGSQPASAPQVAATAAPARPAEPKPAAPPVKDMGLFGNFEIGAGFGAQKANGFAGMVAGVTDGQPSPDSLRALGRQRQTMEGKVYTLPFLGNCGRYNYGS